MKKIVFILAFFFIPLLVHGQSMVEIKDKVILDESGEELINKEVYPASNRIENQEKEATTITVEINVPKIKILPSNPFYFLKKAWENVRGFLIFNTVKKAEYKINLANRRLEEVESLAQKKKTDLIEKTTGEFNKEMAEANKLIEKANKKKKDLQNVYNLLDENRKKHEAVFIKLLNQIPDQAKDAIEKTKEMSQTSFETAKNKINQGEIKGKIKEGLNTLENQLK